MTVSVIRLVIPALTEETRRDPAKEVKKVGENAKVVVRQYPSRAMDEAALRKSKRNHWRRIEDSEKIFKVTDDARNTSTTWLLIKKKKSWSLK